MMRTALERTEIEWWEANRPPSLSGLTHTHKKKKEEKKREKGKYVSTYHNNMIIIPQAVTN